MNKTIFIILISVSMFTISSAASSNTASFIPRNSTVTLNQQGSASTIYTVELMSGISGYSKINFTNIGILNSHGITVSLTNSSGIPPFFGTLTVSAGQNTYPMLYNLSIVVTGNDTQTNPTILYINILNQNPNTVIPANTIVPPTNTTTIPMPPIPRLLKISEITNTVNAVSGGIFSFGNVTAVISPDTYIKIGNQTYSNYNFSIIIFVPQNMSIAPVPYNISYAYGFAVNGQISPDIKFTDPNGNVKNIKTLLNGNATNTALELNGGSYNSIAYNFGNYNSYMNWTYNASTNTIQNANMSSPGAWVVFHAPFELYLSHGLLQSGIPPTNVTNNIPPSNTPTTIGANGATTSIPITNNTPSPSKSDTLTYLTYIALILVIAAILFLVYKRTHK